MNFPRAFIRSFTFLSTVSCASKLDTPTPEVDISSGFAFPRTMMNNRFSLFGSGLRQVTILRFNTYAMGIYFDASQVSQLPKMELETFDECMRFTESLSCALIRITPARNTNGTHMRNAFTKLFNSLKSNDSEAAIVAQENDIEQFVTCFPQTLPVGSELLIRVEPPQGIVTVLFNGREINSLHSKWLCTRLVSAFLDKQRNMIPKLVDEVHGNLSALLK